MPTGRRQNQIYNPDNLVDLKNLGWIYVVLSTFFFEKESEIVMSLGIFLLVISDNLKGCDCPSVVEGCLQKNEEKYSRGEKSEKREEEKKSSRKMEPKEIENRVPVASVTCKSVTPSQLPFI